MMILQRGIRGIALIALLMMISMGLSAQESESSLVAAGSGITNPALASLLDAAEIADYTINNTGTDVGFSQLCAGEAQLVSATRTINPAEASLCEDAGITYIELLVGHDILAVIANPDDTFLTCLTRDEVSTIFAPSAEGRITAWDDIVTAPSDSSDPEATPEPDAEALPSLSVYLPQDNTLNYVILDNLVDGVGLRDDATIATSEESLAAVSETNGALAVVSVETALAAGDAVTIVELAGDANCLSPNAENVESGLYPAATSFYLYVAEAARPILDDTLNALVAGDLDDALTAVNFTPVSDDTLAVNLAVLTGEAPERAFSAEEATYTLPPNTTGTINVGGATSGFRLADSVANQLAQTQQALTINRDFIGQAQALDDFCNNESDILFVNGDSSDLCEEIAYVTYPIGSQAVVLVANAENTYSACLTTDQIVTIWQAASAETVTQWNQVADTFPEEAMTLFSTRDGDVFADLLLIQADSGMPLPMRGDTAQQSSDALFRAAATANVSGALTYMSWQDYQDVLANDQQNIQLVGVNAGEGCIVPDQTTISDGSYPLSRQTSLVVSQTALATVPIQGYVWQIYTDASQNFFDASDFVGLDERDLADLRNQLLTDFRDAGVAASEAAAEETEPEAEATAEPTDD